MNILNVTCDDEEENGGDDDDDDDDGTNRGNGKYPNDGQ